MKKFTFFLVLGLLFFQSNVFAQRNCYSYEYLMQEIQQDPQRLIRLQQIEEQTRRIIQSGELQGRAVVTIPVVVHVVYNRRNTVEDISDAQIQSQIDVLNEDFRTVFPGGAWPQAADSQIEFCMAKVDPSGNLTDGITRTSSRKRSHGTSNSVKYSSQGGEDAWPADQYMNIWVCNIGGGILGYAQFPGGNPATDGVVIDYRYFGTVGTATYPFHLGRTGTHEVGHYLGLRHIWGDGNCNVDDGISDTPVAGGPNYTAEPCTDAPDSCPSSPDRDMFENYMDYSDDGCMSLFTAGQAAVMQGIMAGTRANLANSTVCSGTPPPTNEICDNGIDDDNDGLIDCDDPDCGNDPNCQVGSECTAPTLIGATPSGNTNKRKVKMVVSWTAVSGAVSYTVEWRTSGSGGWSSGSTSGTSYQISNLTNGNTYEWKVTANCPGSSATSTTASFIAGQSSRSGARGPLQAGSDVQVYPNPARNIMLVDLSHMREAQVLHLTDITGRILREVRIDQEASILEVNVHDLPNGLYLVRISDGEGSRLSSTKLIVQH
ncbi:MAG: M43 family zinc metalloprotease [Saprospiraceae bacterium]|nr:T9SS type A sorting domain-containing protein [Lewinella sp.]